MLKSPDTTHLRCLIRWFILSVLVRSCDTTGNEQQQQQQQNSAAPLCEFKIGPKHIKGSDSCFRFLNFELYIYLNMLWIREDFCGSVFDF